MADGSERQMSIWWKCDGCRDEQLREDGIVPHCHCGGTMWRMSAANYLSAQLADLVRANRYLLAALNHEKRFSEKSWKIAMAAVDAAVAAGKLLGRRNQ